MYIPHSISCWTTSSTCDINKCPIANCGDSVIWDISENVKLGLFTTVFLVHIKNASKKQTPNQSSSTKALQRSMRKHLSKLSTFVKTKPRHKSPRQQSWRVALELHITLEQWTSLNQLEKHSSWFYNYLQLIKPFVVKIATRWKCCELIIPKVPGMVDKKVSRLFKPVLQKKSYCSLAATSPQ